jgi:hypothetical protein
MMFPLSPEHWPPQMWQLGVLGVLALLVAYILLDGVPWPQLRWPRWLARKPSSIHRSGAGRRGNKERPHELPT